MALNLDKIFEDNTEEEAVKILHEYYYNDNVSSKALGKALDVTDVTIRAYFKKYNLPLKQHGGLYKGKDIHISLEEYMEKTTKELMEKYHCSQFTIYQLTKTYPSKSGRAKKHAEEKK